MKEDDPTILNNESSPVRNGSGDTNRVLTTNSTTYINNTTTTMSQPPPPPLRNDGGVIWTPLKGDESLIPRSSTMAMSPSSPADSDDVEVEVSPMQHLMMIEEPRSSRSNHQSNFIRKSDDDDNDYFDVDLKDGDNEQQQQQQQRRKKLVLYSLCCLVVLMITAAVVTVILLFVVVNHDSDKTSSEAASSSTTKDDPPTSMVDIMIMSPSQVPVPTIAIMNNSTTTNAVPTNIPSTFFDTNNNNNTDTPTTIQSGDNNLTTGIPSISPIFVSSPTTTTGGVNNITTNTPITTFMPTVFNVSTLVPSTIVPVVVAVPTTPFVEANMALVLPILQTFLLPNDYTSIISMDTLSVFSQTYQYMITSDLYMNSATTTIISEVQIFQRYILMLLNNQLPISSSSSIPIVRINPVTDHCIWNGIACNSNTTDTIIDGVVTDLIWSEYNMQGTIPTTLQYLSSLTKLDLASNELTGTIPNELYYNVTQLQYLYLHDNSLIGTLSNDGLLQLSNLKHLFLNDNRFTGTLPQNLGSPGTNAASARVLEWLNVYNNSFTGSIPLNWNLRNIFLLDLGRNQLTGSIPADWITHMFNLKILYLNHNQLSGSFPTNFTQIGNNRLWLLQVNNNLLTGTIPGGYNVRQLDLTEYQNNLFTSMDPEHCRNIVFVGGEMVSMRSDCGATCPCTFYCGTNECY